MKNKVTIYSKLNKTLIKDFKGLEDLKYSSLKNYVQDADIANTEIFERNRTIEQNQKLNADTIKSMMQNNTNSLRKTPLNNTLN